MTPPMEHDYIGLSAAEPNGSAMVPKVEEEEMSMGSLRETELRLGPPGFPERKVELTLGLPPPAKGGGTAVGSLGSKRGFSDAIDGNGSKCWVGLARGGEGKGGALALGAAAAAAANKDDGKKGGGAPPAAKAQVVGWPPIRNYRKNTMAANPSKNSDDVADKQGSGCLYVKVSMDGAPYLRKVDLRLYYNYKELSSALEKMFSCFTVGSHGVPNKEGLCQSRLNDLHGSEYVLTYEDKDGDWMLVGDVPWDMFTDTCKRLRIMKGSEAIGLAPRAAEKRKS